MLIDWVDASNGADTNAGWEAWNNQTAWQEQNPANPNPANPTDKPTAKDPQAEMRYQISNAKREAKEAKEELARIKEESGRVKPVFDDETDPDWKKEIEYTAEQRAEQKALEILKKSWLQEKLESIETERYIDNVYNKVAESHSSEFEKYWISKVSRDEVVATMRQIDEQGLTPTQIAMLAKHSEIQAKMKPSAFTPWVGTKSNTWDRPETQAEVNANIYKKFWVFGH